MGLDLKKLAKGLLPIIGAVAPTIASFIPGGPSVIAVLDALGVSTGGKTTEMILADAKDAASDSERLSHVLAMEQEYTKQRGQDLANVVSARKDTKEIGFATPHFVLSCLLLALFSIVLIGIIFFDAGSKTDATMMSMLVGALLTEVARDLAFWKGSSLGSKMKDK